MIQWQYFDSSLFSSERSQRLLQLDNFKKNIEKYGIEKYDIKDIIENANCYKKEGKIFFIEKTYMKSFIMYCEAINLLDKIVNISKDAYETKIILLSNLCVCFYKMEYWRNLMDLTLQMRWHSSNNIKGNFYGAISLIKLRDYINAKKLLQINLNSNLKNIDMDLHRLVFLEILERETENYQPLLTVDDFTKFDSEFENNILEQIKVIESRNRPLASYVGMILNGNFQHLNNGKDYVENCKNIGDLFLKLNNLTLAQGVYNECFMNFCLISQLNPNLFTKLFVGEMFASISCCHFKQDNYTEALNMADEALQHNEKECKAIICKARCLKKLKKYDMAFKFIQNTRSYILLSKEKQIISSFDDIYFELKAIQKYESMSTNNMQHPSQNRDKLPIYFNNTNSNNDDKNTNSNKLKNVISKETFPINNIKNSKKLETLNNDNNNTKDSNNVTSNTCSSEQFVTINSNSKIDLFSFVNKLTFLCNACDMSLINDDNEILNHCKSKLHEDNIIPFFCKANLLIVTNENCLIKVNLNKILCSVCGKFIINTDKVIVEHVNGSKHDKKLKNLNKEIEKTKILIKKINNISEPISNENISNGKHNENDKELLIQKQNDNKMQCNNDVELKELYKMENLQEESIFKSENKLVEEISEFCQTCNKKIVHGTMKLHLKGKTHSKNLKRIFDADTITKDKDKIINSTVKSDIINNGLSDFENAKECTALSSSSASFYSAKDQFESDNSDQEKVSSLEHIYENQIIDFDKNIPTEERNEGKSNLTLTKFLASSNNLNQKNEKSMGINIKSMILEKNNQNFNKSKIIKLPETVHKFGDFLIIVICSQCFDMIEGRKNLQHTCTTDNLAAQTLNDIRWVLINNIPINERQYNLCPNLMNSGSCDNQRNCNYPHSKIEINLWKSDKNGEFNIGSHLKMINTAYSNNIYVSKITKKIEDFIKLYPGTLLFNCEKCYSSKKEFYPIDFNLKICPQGIHEWKYSHIAVYHDESRKYTTIGMFPKNVPIEICDLKLLCPIRTECLKAHSSLEYKVWSLLWAFDISLLEFYKRHHNISKDIRKNFTTEDKPVDLNVTNEIHKVVKNESQSNDIEISNKLQYFNSTKKKKVPTATLR